MKGTEPKDYFSAQSGLYASFRPTYPAELYDFVFRHLARREKAWDCATGNGQVALYLADHFERIYATDISANQLAHAIPKDNISYDLSAAEQTAFPDNTFDLIAVGQALHWLDRNRFFREVERTARPGGLLAVWGYSLMHVDPTIDDIVMDFYLNTVGPYWDDARKIVEDEYRALSFPFEEIPSPGFNIALAWTVDQLAGYLLSWSATQKYLKLEGVNPVHELIERISAHWNGAQTKTVNFPLFLRLFRIK